MRPDGEIAEGGAIDLLRGRKVIVKPSCAGSSQGITEKSICDFEWRSTAKRLLKKFPDGVLVEQFIVGYDVTVACAGGQVLPPVVFGLRTTKKNKPMLFRDVYTRTWKSTSSDMITAMPLKTKDKNRIQKTATVILKETLGDLSFGRVDFRMTEDGALYFLEVNGLPCLDRNAGPDWPEAEGVFPVAARVAGKTYEQVILSIVDSAVKRFKIKGATE
jgi:D-alanine-D-alanine ligase